MKKKLNVGVVVTLSGRWPRELPEKRFKEYGEWTINAFPECNVVRFDRVVCTKEDMEECIDSFKKQEVELLIMVYGAQVTTFAVVLQMPCLYQLYYGLRERKNGYVRTDCMRTHYAVRQ